MRIELVAPRKRGSRGNRLRHLLPWLSRCRGNDGWGVELKTVSHHATAAAGLGARTPSRWQIATSRSARFSV